MQITLSFEGVCANGGHVDIGVVVDGGQKKITRFDVDDIRGPVDDREAFIANVIRLSLTGLTRAQARTKLQAGLSITL